MTIEVKVIAHSRNHGSPDLITLQAKYPRMIHSEMMTHRVFSRNASSSRAIPIERMIRDVETDPAMPVAWGSNKPGMQAGEEIEPLARERAKREWLWACRDALQAAKRLAQDGLHKQIVNRLLEPFAHISCVITGTDWQNFFDLRCHPDADPTMRALAEAMRDAVAGSGGVERETHLPYFSTDDMDMLISRGGSLKECHAQAMMISAARCARVSYLTHDGKAPDIEKDLALAKKLLDAKHMSPFEHQAHAWTSGYLEPALCGNFRQWYQHRQMLESR